MSLLIEHDTFKQVMKCLRALVRPACKGGRPAILSGCNSWLVLDICAYKGGGRASGGAMEHLGVLIKQNWR